MEEPQGEYFRHRLVYAGQTVEVPRKELCSMLQSQFTSFLKTDDTKGLPFSDRMYPRKDVNAMTIYTGVGGVAMAYFHLHCKSADDPALKKLLNPTGNYGPLEAADAVLQPILSSLSDPKAAAAAIESVGTGFHGSVPGLLALGVGIKTALGQRPEAEALAKQLCQCGGYALSSETPCEVLYGAAGYLLALTWLQKYQFPIDEALVVKIITRLMEEGLANAGDGWPMRWGFFGTNYLGAAHGVTGILYAMLAFYPQVPENYRGALKECLNCLCAECSSPNEFLFATSARDEAMHHWCHGFPGAVPVLAKAYLMFKDEKYLEAARWCCERVFAEGALRKGTGLCHGLFGNAYCFLTLYRLTREQRYLFYAVSFYEISKTREYAASVASYEDPQRRCQGIPDTPLSLMEGSAGGLCFLVDLLHPESSNFPGFETTTSPPVLDWIHPSRYPLPLPPTASFCRPLVQNVWEVSLMDPSACERFVQGAYGTKTLDECAMDAIRVGGAFRDIVNGITCVIQRLVDNVMVPSELSRARKSYTRVPGEDYVSSLPPLAEARTTVTEAISQGSDVQDALAEKARKRKGGAVPEPVVDPTDFDRAPRLTVWRAYVLRYDYANHPSIQTHTDACDVTLNLCLRRTCDGGELIFNPAKKKYRHTPGNAVVFWGDTPHHTHAVGKTGERTQLVILYNFLRSSATGETEKSEEEEEGKGGEAPTGTGNLKALQGAMVPAEAFPAEVLQSIFRFLPLWDLANVMYTCDYFNQLANDNDEWRFRYGDSLQCTRFCTVEELRQRNTECPICHCPLSADPPPLPEEEERKIVVCDHCEKQMHRRCAWQGTKLMNCGTHELPIECPGCAEEMRRKKGEGGDDDDDGSDARSSFVPALRLGRRKRNVGTDAEKSRAKRYYKSKIVLRDENWKETYHTCLQNSALWEEATRTIEQDAERRCWRAIIGCFDVHRLRAGRRGTEHPKDSDDGKTLIDIVPGEESCEECDGMFPPLFF